MCECIKRINKKLSEHNAQIELPIMVRGAAVPFVSTIKLDGKKRGKPVRMFASFCPFCGEKYPQAAE